MDFGTFDLAIDALHIIAENEERARDAGIEIQGLTDPMINALMAVLDECYKGYCGQNIGYFCWELDFGKTWRPGKVTDRFGRDVKLSSVYELYDHLEHEMPFETEWDYPTDNYMVGHGRYKGMDYYLCWYGSWWCVYLDVTGTPFHGLQYDAIDLDCHGGLTYSDQWVNTIDGKERDPYSWFIGWDYAHMGDRGLTMRDFAKIEQDAKDVIEQLIINE